MSLSTYAELQTAVANYLERSDLTDRIPEFIALTEARMNREIRCNRMITRSTATIADEFSALPTDFLAPRSMRLTTASKWLMSYVTPEQMGDFKEGSFTQSGELLSYSVVGSEFEFFPVPTEDYTVALTYFAQIPALSDANTSNWVLANHPDAYLHGALLEAAIYLRDAEMQGAEKTLFDEATGAIQGADKRDAYAFNLNPTPGASVV